MKNLTFQPLAWVGLTLVLCTAVLAQSQATQKTLSLPSLPRPLVLYNSPDLATVTQGDTLTLAAKGGTNLFTSPEGNYTVENAPMALFEPDADFLLTAKVSANLQGVYDVGALVLYQDEKWWAKLCFENSPRKEHTIVSVVTREVSDDANSETVAGNEVFLAIARKGSDITFHYSTDGKTWRLVRQFLLNFHPGVKIGFAVHGSESKRFQASFSNVVYTPVAPKNMRDINHP